MITLWSSGFNPRLEDKYSCHDAVMPDSNDDDIDDDDEKSLFMVSCWRWHTNAADFWIDIHKIYCLSSCFTTAVPSLMITLSKNEDRCSRPTRLLQSLCVKLWQRTLKVEEEETKDMIDNRLQSCHIKLKTQQQSHSATLKLWSWASSILYNQETPLAAIRQQPSHQD